MKFDWKGIGQTVASAAPIIGGLLGGPAGASVGALVSSVLGCENSPQAVNAAIAKDPQAMAKLRMAEMDHKEDLEKLRLKEIEIYLDDRDSARSRQVELAKAGSADNTQTVLAYGSTIGFFGCIFAMFYIDTAPAMRDVLLVLMGTLSGTVKDLYGYYFGSSKPDNK